MGADSAARRFAKKLLAPLLGETSYQLIQSAAMAWDIRRGAMTEPEIDLIRYAVRAGETAIDIGANYGVYSYHLSRALGPEGKVYAFEPIPFTAGAFRNIARVLRFRGVELIEKGCGEKAGVIDFTVPVQDSGAIIAGTRRTWARATTIGPGASAKVRASRKTKTIQCEVIALDDYLGPLENVSFVKCDIEGADLFALRGARKIIERNRPVIVCEINPWFLEGFGLRVEDFVAFFDELGFKMYRYERGRLRPEAGKRSRRRQLECSSTRRATSAWPRCSAERLQGRPDEWSLSA